MKYDSEGIAFTSHRARPPLPVHHPSLSQNPHEMDGNLITPLPSFTIKTVNTSLNTKVFVNVCTHPDVVPPRNVKRLNADGEEVEGLSVPVAVGVGRKGGKGGKDAMRYGQDKETHRTIR